MSSRGERSARPWFALGGPYPGTGTEMHYGKRLGKGGTARRRATDRGLRRSQEWRRASAIRAASSSAVAPERLALTSVDLAAVVLEFGRRRGVVPTKDRSQQPCHCGAQATPPSAVSMLTRVRRTRHRRGGAPLVGSCVHDLCPQVRAAPCTGSSSDGQSRRSLTSTSPASCRTDAAGAPPGQPGGPFLGEQLVPAVPGRERTPRRPGAGPGRSCSDRDSRNCPSAGDGVHRVSGHDPVGREFSARHDDQARCRPADGVLPGQPLSFGASSQRRLRSPGPRTTPVPATRGRRPAKTASTSPRPSGSATTALTWANR